MTTVERSANAPIFHWVVDVDQEGERLDAFVSAATHISRAEAIRLIDEGSVRLQGRRAKKGMRIQAGQQIELCKEPTDVLHSAPDLQLDLPIEVLHEDEDMVVINKWPGAHCHPLRPGEPNTVASAVLARYPECAQASLYAREGGVCHRLDQYTSGALVFARHRLAWVSLHQAFLQNQNKKEYIALCCGTPHQKTGQIDWPILPTPGHPEKMQIATFFPSDRSSRNLEAVTRFTVLESRGEYALLKASMETGRRHQIRVHLQSIGLPLVGDILYGGKPAQIEDPSPLRSNGLQAPEGPFLHASSIKLHFTMGTTTKNIEVTAPMPSSRKALLSLLGFHTP